MDYLQLRYHVVTRLRFRKIEPQELSKDKKGFVILDQNSKALFKLEDVYDLNLRNCVVVRALGFDELEEVIEATRYISNLNTQGFDAVMLPLSISDTSQTRHYVCVSNYRPQ